jgi:hypothetical protein
MKKIVITTGVVAIAGGVATALFMSSCDPDCQVEAKPSVIVQVVDQNAGEGAVKYVAADEVWYEWTDEETGEKLSKKAERMDDEGMEWMLGAGRPGTYTYHAKVCGQQYDSEVTLDLNEEGCEVDTEMVELAVDAASCVQARAAEPTEDELDVTTKVCTLEARASVIANVVAEIDGRKVPVPTDRVFYVWSGEPNGREMPGVCINEDCSQFVAGWEKEGDFTVGVEVCGAVARASATVGKTSNGCHVETQSVRIVADASGCKELPEYEFQPPEKESCSLELRPSAFLTPVTEAGDMWLPYPTEDLWFEHDGTRHRGYCAEKADNGKCQWWITGWDRTGRFKAYTETCGVETAVTYSVEATEDGCHPKTAFVPVFIDTHGCIRAPGPKYGGSPATPTTPDDVTR